MRIVVLDDCRLMAWVVRRLCPPGVEVVGLDSFEDACRAVGHGDPDAAIVNMTLAQLPWSEFQELCATRTPPVPVLYESALFASAADAGLGEDGPLEFLRKPVPLADLEAALARLIAAAEKARNPQVC